MARHIATRLRQRVGKPAPHNYPRRCWPGEARGACFQKRKTMSRPGSRTIDILLVEDNPGDVRLTIEGLAEGNIPNRLHVARDGVEALEFLRRDGAFADAVRPDLILLDLNLPRMGGREVLARLKADPDLKAIPTIVLSTSRAEQDVSQSYALQANCYIAKPVDLDAFIRVIKAIEDFWLTTAILPTRR